MLKKAIHHEDPEIRDSYRIINYKGERIIVIQFKPQYLVTDDNSKPKFVTNSLKKIKKFIDNGKN